MKSAEGDPQAGDVGRVLAQLAAPVFLADADGCIRYANAAFQEAFADEAGALAPSSQLGEVFQGAACETLLQAVAAVLYSGESASFQLDEPARSWCGLASPARDASDAGAVLVMLGRELPGDADLLGLAAEIEEPVEEGIACLEELLEQTGGRRGERHRLVVERAIASLTRARKRGGELVAALSGARGAARPAERCDVVSVLHQVRGRLDADFAGAGVPLTLLASAELPAVRGDAVLLEGALVHLLRHRIAETGGGHTFRLAARATGSGTGRAVLVSIVDLPAEGRSLVASPASAEPLPVREAVEALGGQLHTLIDPQLGRATVLSLAAE